MRPRGGRRRGNPCRLQAGRGERPLWDFPNGLYQREVAAYALSDALGWGIVPHTVVRDERRSVRARSSASSTPTSSSTTSRSTKTRPTIPQLARICAFDLLVNNTDRKSGHCLLDGDGHIWAIDNGLSLLVEPKLRTVIWEFAGQPVPAALLDAVADAVDRNLESRLTGLLDPFERDAVGSAGQGTAARAVLSHRRDRPRLSVATGLMLTGAELVDQGDLDELVRHVDRLCATRDWDGLVDLRDRCRAALERGSSSGPSRRWPSTASLSSRPVQWAGPMVVEGAGRLALGPLAEVAASTHRWDDLGAYIPEGPLRAVAAHERVVRGEDLARDDSIDRRVLDIPLVLASWEPDYPPATYAMTPPSSRRHRHPFRAPLPPRTFRWRRCHWSGTRRWTTSARSRACGRPPPTGCRDRWPSPAMPPWRSPPARSRRRSNGVVRLAPLTGSDALAWLGWAGASGGAEGRRPGAARGRVAVWWLLHGLAGWTADWPIPADELGAVVDELRWYAWDDGSPTTGWSLRLAIEDPTQGVAWALSATDSVLGVADARDGRF